MKKEINFILEEKDFNKKSGISQNTFNNLIQSFKNYLNMLDKNEIADIDENGKKFTISRLEKLERENIRYAINMIKGGVTTLNDKGEMKAIYGTERTIFNLIPLINEIYLLRKKINELEKNQNEHIK